MNALYDDILTKVDAKKSLEKTEMSSVMKSFMSGESSEEFMEKFLLSLKAKGESITEIVEAAKVMREFAVKINIVSAGLLDTCGTGGDGRCTINVSTACALIAAACGVRVAKHGNKAVSSHSGSADFLTALGIQVRLNADKVAQSIEQTNFGFLFAPIFHPAMKNVAPVRQKIKTRTLFNLLGPLTNPAGAEHQLLGVYDRDLQYCMAKALAEMGSTHVLVVHGEKDGLDEVALNGSTLITEWVNGKLKEYSIRPRDYQIEESSIESLQCQGPEESVQNVLDIFESKLLGPKYDFLRMNAGVALYAADKAESIEKGILLATEAIGSGQVRDKVVQIKNLHSQWKE